MARRLIAAPRPRFGSAGVEAGLCKWMAAVDCARVTEGSPGKSPQSLSERERCPADRGAAARPPFQARAFLSATEAVDPFVQLGSGRHQKRVLGERGVS